MGKLHTRMLTVAISQKGSSNRLFFSSTAFLYFLQWTSMTFIIRNPAEFKIYLLSLYSTAVSQNWREGSVVNFFFPVHLWFLRFKATSMLLMEKNCGFHTWSPHHLGGPSFLKDSTVLLSRSNLNPKSSSSNKQTASLNLPVPKFSISQIIKNGIQFQILMEAMDGIQ